MQVDAQMSKDRQIFYDASLQYVFKIQEVQERKKFEFVEPVRLCSYTVHVSFERCKDFVISRHPLLLSDQWREMQSSYSVSAWSNSIRRMINLFYRYVSVKPTSCCRNCTSCMDISSADGYGNWWKVNNDSGERADFGISRLWGLLLIYFAVEFFFKSFDYTLWSPTDLFPVDLSHCPSVTSLPAGFVYILPWGLRAG